MPSSKIKHTLIAHAGGIAFYEDYYHGSDVPLLIKINGNFECSGFYDLPTNAEALNYCLTNRILTDSQKKLNTIFNSIGD